MADQARETATAKMADRLAEYLSDDRLGEGRGYTREQCEALADRMAGLEFAGTYAGAEERRDLLAAMLDAQPSLSAAEVLATASVLPKLNLARLLIGAGLAAELLGVHQTTLLRRRWDGDIDAALIDRVTTRTGGSVYYHLSDILYVLAYQARYPYPGGSVKAWPELH